MLFRRIVSEGLSHNSYIIGSGGQAAVIDPRRDCDQYLEIAAAKDLAITHIFETHRNEDYVTGSLELAKRCGAAIYHGGRMQFQFGNPVKEHDTFSFGSLELTILETPGHTEESISIVLRDREVSPEPYTVFTGDTLFAGDIARTDFYGKERNGEMAGKIHDSIVQKILPLGEGVIICPAHGAGSICGDEIADHPITSVGYERKTNKILAMVREDFVARRITEFPYVPPYFRQMEKYNRDGAPLLKTPPALHPLTVADVERFRGTGCQLVDIRSPTSFAAGYIDGSISIWREGLAAFIGWFLNYQIPIILVDDFNLSLGQVLTQFIRQGFDNIEGYLVGGFPAWVKAGQNISTIPTCSVHQLKKQLESGSPFLLDVRDIKNWRSIGHIPHARNIYIGELLLHLDEIPRDEPVFIYCDSGYKGSLAASIFTQYNYHNVTNILGGITAWKRAGYTVEL